MPPSDQLNRTEVRVATRVWQGHTNPEIGVALWHLRAGDQEPPAKHIRQAWGLEPARARLVCGARGRRLGRAGTRGTAAGSGQ